MHPDPKRMIAASYDQLAPAYQHWTDLNPSSPRMRYLARLIGMLPPSVTILDVGCGNGIPVTQALATQHRVTGVDLSAQQLILARQNAPTATFLQADVMTLDVPPATFDVVVAFYTLLHVPRQEQAQLLQQIYSWLRPNGLLLATMGAIDLADRTFDNWLDLGQPMFFSHFDADTNRRLIRACGYTVLDDEIVPENDRGSEVEFLWITARKTGSEAT
jgi:SAM-dependent methyltransferase